MEWKDLEVLLKDDSVLVYLSLSFLLPFVRGLFLFFLSVLSSYVFVSLPVHYIFHLFSSSLFQRLYCLYNLIKKNVQIRFVFLSIIRMMWA